jgi:PII-like signaling protein
MSLVGENVLLRIFLDTRQRWHHVPAYEALVEEARRRGMAGATVLEGIEGFGQGGPLLKENAWHLGQGREVIVEIVDTPAKIEAFAQTVQPMLAQARVTLERARVVFQKSKRPNVNEGGTP